MKSQQWLHKGHLGSLLPLPLGPVRGAGLGVDNPDRLSPCLEPITRSIFPSELSPQLVTRLSSLPSLAVCSLQILLSPSYTALPHTTSPPPPPPPFFCAFHSLHFLLSCLFSPNQSVSLLNSASSTIL